MVTFEDLGIDKRIIKAISEIHYKEPTPIQEKCIKVVSEGYDCVAQSSTGSGKTAAFGLPILQKIKPGQGLQFVILTPTRELCLQVKDSLVAFSKYLGLKITAIYGGAPLGRQIDELISCEVMVGTPGRVLDHISRSTIRLSNVHYLVLDEADRMLDMGFIDDVIRITSNMPAERQTMLFSATIPDEIKYVISRHLKAPVYVKTESYVGKGQLRQTFYKLRQEEKFSLLVHLLKSQSKGVALVFCATRRRVDALTENLVAQGVEAVGIHGGMEQNKRLKAIDRLKRGTIRVLVATDVAARGLDIRNITHIYNYDVPKSSEEYIHRIGRTARAGAEGDAITFVSSMDAENFNAVISDKSLELREETVIPDHQRLPYKARGGSFRRGRPEGVSRTGKPKSDFSNTHPRENSKKHKGRFSHGRGFQKREGERNSPGEAHSLERRVDQNRSEHIEGPRPSGFQPRNQPHLGFQPTRPAHTGSQGNRPQGHGGFGGQRPAHAGTSSQQATGKANSGFYHQSKNRRQRRLEKRMRQGG